MPLLSVRLSRRQVLGSAAGVVGAAALGAGLERALSSPALVSADGWPSPLDNRRARAAHLLRRAAFGYTTAELDAAAAMSYDDLVDSLVTQAPQPLPLSPGTIAHTRVAAAWYEHMATTTAPFPERMTLFWHGVLTSDYRNAGRRPLVLQQNALYRTNGLRDLRTLLTSVTTDPLMMRYLNLDASTAAAPNENYARELMELFTLGPGNYTETDVRESARALSGLRITLVDAGGNRLAAPRYDRANPAAYAAQLGSLVAQGARFSGVLVPRLHDSGMKTFLGRTGDLGPDDVIDQVLAQPACAPFVTRRAMTFFVTPNPAPADVAAIAAQFRSSGYDLRTLMRAIFRSAAFTDPANYRSLMRSPTDYMVAAMRAVGDPTLATLAVRSAPGMDQVLYDPPNVAGWPQNGGWINSSSMLARINFATAATAAAASLPDIGVAVRDQVDGVVGAATGAQLRSAHNDRDRWFALVASPEFQLK